MNPFFSAFAFNETAAEILAVAVFYAISYLLERRRKKNAPPEEEATPDLPDFPDEIFETPQAPVPEPVRTEAAQEEFPLEAVARIDPAKELEPEIRALGAFSLEIAQDLGRVRSIRTVVKNVDPAVRSELDKLREQIRREDESGTPGDQIAHWAREQLHTLRTSLSRFHHHGFERLKSDTRFQRYDSLAQQMHQPFGAVFQQRTEEGAYAHLHAVPETLPTQTLRKLMQDVGWVQIPMNDSTALLEVTQRTIEQSILHHPQLQREILEALPGTRGAGTIGTDGSLRKSGVRNWVAHWSDTLFTDGLASLYAGPDYGDALFVAGRLRPENWERFDVPRRLEPAHPPGEIRIRWIQRVLDHFSMGTLQNTEREEDILLRWGAAVTDMDVAIFDDALDEAFDVFLNTSFGSLGDVPVHRITGWNLSGTERRQADMLWEAQSTNPSWSKGRAFLICSLRALAVHPSEGRKWVHALEGQAGGLRLQGSVLGSEEPDWLKAAIRDQLLFGLPRGRGGPIRRTESL